MKLFFDLMSDILCKIYTNELSNQESFPLDIAFNLRLCAATVLDNVKEMEMRKLLYTMRVGRKSLIYLTDKGKILAEAIQHIR